MADMEANMRKGVLVDSNATTQTNATCDASCVPDPVDIETLNHMNEGYLSWHTLGFNAFSALSVGTCAFTVLTINGVVSLLSCNSVFSILSLNSAFSILSTNSAFAIGCVDKRFAVCF